MLSSSLTTLSQFIFEPQRDLFIFIAPITPYVALTITGYSDILLGGKSFDCLGYFTSPLSVYILSVWGRHFFMLVLEIETSKPPRNDLKSGQRYRNDSSV